MEKNIKTRKGSDGCYYPYTSPDLVIDGNGKSATTKFNEIDSQFKDIVKQVENVGQPTQEQINTAINQAIEDGKISGSGTRTDITNSDTFAIGSSSSSGDTPVIPETNYSITNTLTNCTSSNNNISVLKDSSYTTTLTANSGYTLGSISVTMGGTDVSSTVVSGNTINISKVTGNVVITCTAKVTFNYLDYLKRESYSLSAKSSQYSTIRFATESNQNIYSVPVNQGNYKMHIIASTDRTTNVQVNSGTLASINSDTFGTIDKDITDSNIDSGVLGGVTITPTTSQECGSAIKQTDGKYLFTVTLQFGKAGYCLFALKKDAIFTLEEVN